MVKLLHAILHVIQIVLALARPVPLQMHKVVVFACILVHFYLFFYLQSILINREKGYNFFLLKIVLIIRFMLVALNST